MPESVIRLDADISQITVKFKKVGDDLAGVGEKAKKGWDWVGGLDKQFEAMGKRLMSVAAVAQAIGTAYDVTNKVADQKVSQAEQRNQFALRAAKAAMGAGGTATANRAFIEGSGGGPGLTTMEGRTAFMESIAAIQQERTSKGLPAIPIRDLQRYQGYYNRGGDVVFGEGGAKLTDAIKQFPYSNGSKSDVGIGRYLAGNLGGTYRGQDINGLIQSNLQNLPPDAVQALIARSQAEENARAAYEAGGTDTAQNALATKQYLERLGIEHPYGMGASNAIKDTLGGIPVVGGPIKSGIEHDQREDAGERAAGHLEDIADGIKKMTGTSGNPTLPNVDTRMHDSHESIK